MSEDKYPWPYTASQWRYFKTGQIRGRFDGFLFGASVAFILMLAVRGC